MGERRLRSRNTPEAVERKPAGMPAALLLGRWEERRGSHESHSRPRGGLEWLSAGLARAHSPCRPARMERAERRTPVLDQTVAAQLRGRMTDDAWCRARHVPCALDLRRARVRPPSAAGSFHSHDDRSADLHRFRAHHREITDGGAARDPSATDPDRCIPRICTPAVGRRGSVDHHRPEQPHDQEISDACRSKPVSRSCQSTQFPTGPRARSNQPIGSRGWMSGSRTRRRAHRCNPKHR